MNTTDQTPAILNFDNFDLEIHIRVIMRGDEPLFVAKDLCQALGIANSRDAVAALDGDEKETFTNSNVGNSDVKLPNRGLQAVTESGLYALIFRSNKPEAKKFRRWVAGEVLPAIRKHGRYDPAEIAETALSLPPLARRGLIQHHLADAESRVVVLRKQLDLCLVIPGQYCTFHWMLLNGWQPGRGECGRYSNRCTALSRERGLPVGEIKEFEHCGQITRVSRTARTYEPEILKEIIGEAA